MLLMKTSILNKYAWTCQSSKWVSIIVTCEKYVYLLSYFFLLKLAEVYSRHSMSFVASCQNIVHDDLDISIVHGHFNIHTPTQVHTH